MVRQALSFKASDYSRSPPHMPEKATSSPEITLYNGFVVYAAFGLAIRRFTARKRGHPSFTRQKHEWIERQIRKCTLNQLITRCYGYIHTNNAPQITRNVASFGVNKNQVCHCSKHSVSWETNLLPGSDPVAATGKIFDFITMRYVWYGKLMPFSRF